VKGTTVDSVAAPSRRQTRMPLSVSAKASSPGVGSAPKIADA
jgi:hypothetical protein